MRKLQDLRLPVYMISQMVGSPEQLEKSRCTNELPPKFPLLAHPDLPAPTEGGGTDLYRFFRYSFRIISGRGSGGSSDAGVAIIKKPVCHRRVAAASCFLPQHQPSQSVELVFIRQKNRKEISQASCLEFSGKKCHTYGVLLFISLYI